MCCLRTSARCGWSSASATVTVDASIRSSACASRTGVLRKYREVVVMLAWRRSWSWSSSPDSGMPSSGSSYDCQDRPARRSRLSSVIGGMS